MNIFKTVNEVRTFVKQAKKNGKTVGFVPTMGYLHEGHLSLIQRAKAENDICIISIFVNPIQFGPNEDFEKYPRDFERDFKLSEGVGADGAFVPEVGEMYSEGFQTHVDVGELTSTLCGACRPGHFRGVTTVVTKLFNVVAPDRAYFGQKDAQQLLVIERMVKDLNIDIEIVGCPIVREADGLAKSSRNVYLSNEERQQAVVINKGLQEAKSLIKSGERDAKKIDKVIRERLEDAPLGKVDYIEIVDRDTLQSVEMLSNKVLIAVAVYFGRTRLIDNVFLDL